MNIYLTEPPINLFSDIAESKANEIAKEGAADDKNKPTQLRGFYDEILPPLIGYRFCCSVATHSHDNCQSRLR